MPQLNVHLSADLLEEVDAYCSLHQLSKSRFARDGLRQALDDLRVRHGETAANAPRARPAPTPPPALFEAPVAPASRAAGDAELDAMALEVVEAPPAPAVPAPQPSFDLDLKPAPEPIKPAPKPKAPPKAPPKTFDVETRVEDGAVWFDLTAMCNVLGIFIESVVAELDPDDDVKTVDGIDYIDARGIAEARALCTNPTLGDAFGAWADKEGRKTLKQNSFGHF